MSKEPLITIGLPVYNSERFIRQSLDSLLGQSYGDFVLIISDNASTDGTADICHEYAARDPRVTYSRNPTNIGNPGNFNRVFRLCQTPYLKWSTSDDYWAPTFLEKALPVLQRDPSVALCYPAATFIDADGQNPTPYDDCLHLVQDDPAQRFMHLVDNIGRAHQHLGLIRTSMLRRTHLLGAHVHSDINLLAELVLYGKFVELPERLFFRRFHKTSGSWNRGDKTHDAAYYLAAGSGQQLTRWRWHARFFQAVATAPLAPIVRVRLFNFLARRVYWDRPVLARELRQRMHLVAG